MDCPVTAAMIAGLLVGGCATDEIHPRDAIQVDPPIVGYEEDFDALDDHQPTAGGMPAIVPRMDDRWGHDDRFGYDVPHRDWSRRRGR